MKTLTAAYKKAPPHFGALALLLFACLLIQGGAYNGGAYATRNPDFDAVTAKSIAVAGNVATAGLWHDNRAQQTQSYYVSTTGSDSSAGLTTATAYLTLQYAISNLPVNYRGTIEIRMLAGNYAGAAIMGGNVGTQKGLAYEADLIICADSEVASDVTIDSAPAGEAGIFRFIVMGTQRRVHLLDLTINCGGGGYGLYASYQGAAIVEDCVFNGFTSGGHGLFVSDESWIYFRGSAVAFTAATNKQGTGIALYRNSYVESKSGCTATFTNLDTGIKTWGSSMCFAGLSNFVGSNPAAKACRAVRLSGGGVINFANDVTITNYAQGIEVEAGSRLVGDGIDINITCTDSLGTYGLKLEEGSDFHMEDSGSLTIDMFTDGILVYDCSRVAGERQGNRFTVNIDNCTTGITVKAGGRVASKNLVFSGNGTDEVLSDGYYNGTWYLPAFVLTPAALPGSPVVGQFAIDSGDGNKAKSWDGSAWDTLSN